MKRSAQRSQARDFGENPYPDDRDPPEMSLREWLQEDDSRPYPRRRNEPSDSESESRAYPAADADRGRLRREPDDVERGQRPRDFRASAATQPPYAPPQPRRDEARVATIVESAMRKVETRIERSEQRTVDALESVAQWMRRSQADRAKDGETFEAIFDQLSALDGKLTAQVQAPTAAPDFDRRMNALTARLEGLESAPRAPVPPRAQPDAPTPAEPPKASRLGALRNFGVDLAPASSSASVPVPPPTPPAAAPADPAVRDADALRAELRRASENLAAMRRRASEAAPAPQRPSAEEIAALRADVSAMARCVADLAPRNAVVALEGALRDLTERVGALANPDARLALIAPVAASVVELRDAVRAQNASGAAAALEKDIWALGQKVDTLAATAVDRTAFEGIRRQIEETRLSLDGALARIAPLERLERQIGALADKVDSLGLSQRPDADAKLVLTALGDLRDSVERNAPVGVLASIEAKIESLAQRIDKEMPQPKRAAILDMRAIDGLAERIDLVRRSVESLPPAADSSKVEAALRDLSEKLDRRPQTTLDIKPLEAALTNLSQRPIHLDASPLGDIIRNLNAKLEERPAADPSAFEAMLRSLSERVNALDMGGIQASLAALQARSSAAADPGAFEATLRTLSERIEALDMSGIQASLAALHERSGAAADPSAFEGLLRTLSERIEALDTTGIEANLAALNARAAASADLAPLTAAVRKIDAKLEGGAQSLPPAMESLLTAMARRLETIDAKADATREIATQLAAIGEKIDSASANPGAVDLGALETLLHDLGAKIDGQSTLALDMHDMQTRQAQAMRDAPRAEDGQTAALDAIWRRIDEKLSALAPPAAISREVSGLHDRLDAIDATLRPQSGTEDALRELAAQMDDSRRALQALLAAQGAEPQALLSKLSEMRTVQSQSDDAMQQRLARVSDVLEKLIDRIDRIEIDAAAPAPAQERTTWTDKAEPIFAPPQRQDAGPLAPEPPQAPPRAAARPAAAPQPEEPFTEALGAQTERAPRPAVADGKPDYIAAARRAAKTALAETARERAAAKAAPQEPARAAKAVAPAAALKVTEGIETAKHFFAQRRRSILLGLGVVVLLSMAAFVGPRVASTFMKSSEADAPAPVVAEAPAASTAPAADAAAAPSPLAAVSPAPAIDTAPVGSIAPAPAPSPIAIPPSAALIAAIPAWAPQPLRDALLQGDPSAQYELAARYLDGRGTPRDLPAGAKWLAEAAAQGLAPAQYRLASLYEKGLGVFKDLPQAKALYLKAASAGNARAMHNLGVLAAESSGDAKADFAAAADWFRKAAKYGVKDSQFNLGILETRGLGGPQDLKQAWLYFSLAANQGDLDAAKKRDELAAKLDAGSLQAAQQLLAVYTIVTPLAASNDVPIPPGGWDGKPAASSASAAPAPAASPSPSPSPRAAKIGA